MTPYEKNCLQNASFFTAIRGASPQNRIRAEFSSLDDAMSYAKNTFSDGRTMIYAVTDMGLSAHITNA